MIEDQGEYTEHWTSVKLSKRGKPKKSTSNYTHIQMVSINDNTIYYIQHGRGQPYFVQCYMPSNSVSRDACIHTLIPNTCTYAVTTHTFLPFCLQVWPKRLHPRVALHHSDDVTHIHQGCCIACLLQECMKELSLQCCIHFLSDCLLITIWYNISLLKLQCNGRCIHVCNELLAKVVKKLSCVEREESIHRCPTTWKGKRCETNAQDQHLHAGLRVPIEHISKWTNIIHSTDGCAHTRVSEVAFYCWGHSYKNC